MEPEVHMIEKYFQEILHCFSFVSVFSSSSFGNFMSNAMLK